ncbi:MAG: MOSC N-terminal beta barrel domain-containing protein [Pseudolysinimonas sp.]
MPIALTGLRRYPVKSCRGEDLETAIVEPWGLAGDRRWMVVDEHSLVVTAREVHGMLRIVPELVEGGLRLTSAGAEPLFVAEPGAPSGAPSRAPSRDVQIWSSTVAAGSAGPAADAWLSGVLQRSVHLVFLDDPRRRAVEPAFSQPGDVVSFADGYPMLLASQNSLNLLNDWIAEGPRPDEGSLPITRFRPNLIVTGAAPFAEDGWVRVRIGEATFRVAKGCDRCVLTTLDPETGVKQMEPITTLARHRRWDGKTWFAANLLPETPGATLRLGDEVEILEQRDASDGPVRPAVVIA